jgi:hypothetical protein
MLFVIAWRTALRDSGLSSTAKLVGHTLSTHMDGNGGSCFPSVSTVAREASLSDRSVRNGLRLLEAAGLVHTRNGGGRKPGGCYTANRYQACIPDSSDPPISVQDPHSPERHAGLSSAPRSGRSAIRSASPAPDAGEGVHEGVHQSKTAENCAAKAAPCAERSALHATIEEARARQPSALPAAADRRNLSSCAGQTKHRADQGVDSSGYNETSDRQAGAS